MDGKDYVFRREAGDASRAFARLLDRITDRLLPIPVPQIASSWMKYGVTFLGSLVWCIYGTIWTYRHYFPVTARSLEDDIAYAHPVSSIDPFVQFYGITLLILSVILVFLIGRSFDRGRPLTFFFLGLIFPTAALGILKYAFPDGSTGAETSTATLDISVQQ